MSNRQVTSHWVVRGMFLEGCLKKIYAIWEFHAKAKILGLYTFAEMGYNEKQRYCMLK